MAGRGPYTPAAGRVQYSVVVQQSDRRISIGVTVRRFERGGREVGSDLLELRHFDLPEQRGEAEDFAAMSALECVTRGGAH